MKKFILLTAMISCACTKIDHENLSGVSANSNLTSVPTRGANLGIYRLTDKNSGTTLAFFPTLMFGSKPIRAYYRKYIFSRDWQKITSEDRWRTLNWRSYGPNGELQDLYFEAFASNRLTIGFTNYTFGTLSKQDQLQRILEDCTVISGTPVMQEDIFEPALPNVDDEIYIIPLLKNINPLDKNDIKIVQARLMNFKVGAIFQNSSGGNGSIFISSKSTDVQDFYLDANWHSQSPQGFPVFSKKTHRIVGFVEKYYRHQVSATPVGELNLRILSVLSPNLKDITNLPQMTKKLPRPVQKPISPTFSKDWTAEYCKPDYVAEVIRKHVAQRDKQDLCAKGPAEGPRAPWDEGGRCVSKEEVLSALQRATSPEGNGPAGTGVCSEGVVSGDPRWIYSPPQLMPTICAREVDEAIAAYMKQNRDCKKQ